MSLEMRNSPGGDILTGTQKQIAQEQGRTPPCLPAMK